MCQLVNDFYQKTSSQNETAAAVEEHDVGSLMLVYQLQAEQFKEDFEQERQDHQRTKAQLQSLTVQWRNLYNELLQCQDKVRCGVDMVPNSCKWENQKIA